MHRTSRVAATFFLVAIPGVAFAQVLQATELAFSELTRDNDLSQWFCTEPTAYVIDNGVVSSVQGKYANLYTRRRFANFVLRFEFRLSPGANNGIGLRTPLEGDPAYAGMEIQILDDRHPRYEGLEPYQYHGSLYGVAVARRAPLRPTGEWNSQEIACVGDRVVVHVNDCLVLDEDLASAARREALDGRDHPGLRREGGFIALLGHGDRVDFRGIAVAELSDGDGVVWKNSQQSNRSDRGLIR